MNRVRYRLALAAALVATVALTATSQAQARETAGKTLVVSGARSGTAVWKIDREVEVQVASLQFRKDVVDRRGTTGGIIVHRGDTVYFAIIGDRGWKDLLFGYPMAVTLKPGSYTVTLVADGPTTIRLPLKTAAHSYRMRITHPSQTSRVDAAATIVGGVAYTRENFTMHAHDYTMVGHYVTSDALTQADYSCIAAVAWPCPSGWAQEDATGHSDSYGSPSAYGPDVDPGKPAVYRIGASDWYSILLPDARRTTGAWYADVTELRAGTTSYSHLVTITATLSP